MELRRALSVGVSSIEGHEQLEFARGLSGRLGSALSGLEYEARVVAPERLAGAELATAVSGALAGPSTDIAVVHIISHGHRADGGATVFALGSDGVPHADASVAHWLTMQQAEDRPTTLFLLDLCGAGTLARLPWQTLLEKPLRGWVIAACGETQAAYDGRFTQAVISVLEALRAGELDIDPSMRYVPLRTFARAVRQEVNRLTTEADAFPQEVMASLVDISSDVEPPFFLNPAYNPASKPRLRASVDPGLLPFLDDLDEGLDARHFLERATGLGRLTDANSGLVGCFTGRDRELRKVSPWLNGVGAEPLCVVTGSPGAGKSALLGVLVCAAHLQLREVTRPIWEHVAQWPLPVDHLAAVHARQRGVATVVASVARQLNLPENCSIADLVTALRGRSAQPVLVVDALDEADDPVALMNELLLPLVSADRPGKPVRLLVGVRRYDDFVPLLDRAALVDLDDVDQFVLEDNLLHYVQGLLRTKTEYRVQGAVVGAFAHAVASVLARPDADGKRRWGPFLVAGLYTRHFIAAHADGVVTDAGIAAQRGQEVPSDLRGVLELDLKLNHEEYWLRPVLTALAHARGAGMPVSVLARVATVYAADGARPTTGQIRSVLNAARFYLRQSMDSDRSNVYRLFHQGLADTLAEPAPERLGAVLDAMLSSLGPPEHRDWNAAEPYLLRYVLAHATDADRVADVESDPGFVLHPESPLATTATDPAELALAAVRAGNTVLARRAANILGREPLTWQPRWSLGSLGQADGDKAAPGYRAIGISDDGEAIVAAGTGDVVRWRWPWRRQPQLRPQPSDVEEAKGSQVLLSSYDSAIVVGTPIFLLDMKSDSRVRYPDAREVIAAIRTGEWEYVCVDADGEIVRRNLDKGTTQVIRSTGFRRQAWALAESESGVVAFCPDEDDGLIRVEGPQAWRMQLPGKRRVTAFAVSRNGQHLAAGGQDGWFGTCDLSSGRKWMRDGEMLDSSATAVAFAPKGEQIAVGCEGGSVSIFRFDGTRLSTIKVSDRSIAHVALSQDSRRGAAVDRDGFAYGFNYLDTSVGAIALPAPGEGPPEVPRVTTFMEADGELAVALSDGALAQVAVATGHMRSGLVLQSPALKLAVTDIGGQDGILLSTGNGYQLLHPYFGHVVEVPVSAWATDRVDAAAPPACIALGIGLVEVGCSDDALWVKELRSYARPAEKLGAHPLCRVVRCAYVGGRPLAVSGGMDGTVLVWDLEARELRDMLSVGGPVRDIRLVQGKQLMVLVGGELLAFEHFDAFGEGKS
ncbi:NACHT and WD repeat domain-containing protein [Lentzea kentuckyensis]|uniref:NACHT and WD repeat domain-containing protein n=1 Tax=Lentzea kentuckyensis TaxID=360086 RepID=UPI00117B3A6E|nr:NACHT and WD repeat domain-containing protein [Lentzea kentuckyensis]